MTAPPRGGDPVLDILDLSTGKSQRRIQVFDNAFRGGISMDTADIDGDGIYEFLVGAGPTGGPHVKLLRADGNEMLSFFAFDATFTGGTSVAFADVDGNGTKEIVVGAGPGGGPHVKIFQLDGTLLRSFFAFDPSFTGGVFLAAGDLGGDNAQEIVVGAGAGGGPVVKIFDGNSLQVRGEFFAYDSAFLGGVMVALQDYNLDGRLDLVTGPGKGGSPHVKVFDGPSLNLIDQFFAGDPALTEGAFV
ncbi:MAG: Hemolysin, chromosomal [Planctomycetota bacterium]